MHEVSIMQGALQLAEENARKAGGTEIRVIRLRVGLFSGVVPEALEFAFDILRQDTMAAGATLEIERMPGLFQCSGCGDETRLQQVRFECEKCGGMLTLRDGGGELELTQLEVI